MMEDAVKVLLQTLTEPELNGAEQHKSFNKFVKEWEPHVLATPSAKIQKNLSVLQDPLDFFARKLHVDLAIAFRNGPTLIEVLQSGEKELIHKIISSKKVKWLFQKESQLTEVKYLLDELFPKISFCGRMKIIRKLGIYLNCEQKSRELFDGISNKYGTPAAIALLPSCGTKFIKATLRGDTFLSNKLTSKELLKIYKNSPEPAMEYFEKVLSKDKNSYRYGISSWYGPVLKKVLKVDPDKFIQLLQGHKILRGSQVLSSTQANRLMRKYFKKFLQEPEVFYGVITKVNLKQFGLLAPDRKEDFINFLAGLLPESSVSLKAGNLSLDDVTPLLKPIPKDLSMNLMADAIKVAYKGESQNYSLLALAPMSESVLALLPLDIRMALVTLVMEDGDQSPDLSGILHPRVLQERKAEGCWVAFKPIDKSIPELKELIKTEPDLFVRNRILESLVKTCHFNDDEEALLEVLKNFVARHRNETLEVLNGFLRALNENFDLIKLNEESWTQITEIINFRWVSNEKDRYDMLWDQILEKAFIAYLNMGKAPDHFIPMLIRSRINTWYVDGWEWSLELLKTKKYQSQLRQFILKITQHLAKTYPNGPDDYSEKGGKSLSPVVKGLLNLYGHWNRNKKSTDQFQSIKEDPWLLNATFSMFVEDDDTREIIAKLALSDDLLKVDEETFEKYLNLDTYPTLTILMRTLKKDPKGIMENLPSIIHTILNETLDNVLKFMKIIKSQGRKSLISEFLLRSESILAQESTITISNQRKNAILILSKLQPSSQFLNEFIPKFYPNDSKISIPTDSGDNSTIDLLKSSSTVIKFLKNIEVPACGLEALSKFCVGDYLKFSIGALYSLVYHSPEAEVTQYLGKVIDARVSLKKHGIRLLSRVAPKKEFRIVIKNLWTTETNSSIKHVLIQEMFGFGFQSLDDLQVLEGMMESLSVQDKSSIQELLLFENIQRVPSQTLTMYFDTLWDILQNIHVDPSLEITFVELMSRSWEDLIERASSGSTNFVTYVSRRVLRPRLFEMTLHRRIQKPIMSLAVTLLMKVNDHDVSLCLNTIEASLQNHYDDALKSQHGMGMDYSAFKGGLQYFTKILCTSVLHKFIEASDSTESESGSKAKAKERIQRILTRFLSLNSFVTSPIDSLYLKLTLSIIGARNDPKDEEGFIEVGKEFSKVIQAFVSDCGGDSIVPCSLALKSFINECCDGELINMIDPSAPFKLFGIIQGMTCGCGDGDPTSDINPKLAALQLVPIPFSPKHNLFKNYIKLLSNLAKDSNQMVKMSAERVLSNNYVAKYMDE